ncbi:hypothetical protein OH492_08350 [Vibrio chagasii]|nr:hypothetical protein [Vibrio chagasii]
MANFEPGLGDAEATNNCPDFVFYVLKPCFVSTTKRTKVCIGRKLVRLKTTASKHN